MGDTQGKITLPGGLEFRIKYCFNRERGWGVEDGGLLRESKWIIGRINGPLEEEMEGRIVHWGVVSTSSLLSCAKSQSSPVDETLGEQIYDTWVLEFLLEDPS